MMVQEGEVPYTVFDDYMEHMQVPENFWVTYVEPFCVERRSFKDRLGTCLSKEQSRDGFHVRDRLGTCFYVKDRERESWCLLVLVTSTD